MTSITHVPETGRAFIKAQARFQRPQTDRRSRLRHATLQRHRTLERLTQEAACFADASSAVRYLAAMAPLTAGLERALEAAGVEHVVPDWACRRKAEIVSAALSETGAAAARAFDVTSAAAWTSGDVLGALYVVEGATLGGAVLARSLRSAPDAVLRALDPYGAARGPRWRTILARIEAAPAESEPAIVRSARHVFDLHIAQVQALAAAGQAVR